jgi:NAD(P)H-flavin reductase
MKSRVLCNLKEYVPQWLLDSYVIWCIPSAVMIAVKDEHQTIAFCVIVIGGLFAALSICFFRQNDLLQSRILSNDHMGDTHTTLKIKSHESINGFRPGQFVILSDGHRSRKYTPLSVSHHEMVFAIRKYPTETSFSSYLYTRSIGDSITVNGPFGKQYYDAETKTLNTRRDIIPLFANVDTVVLFSGGSGLAPMYILAKSMLESGIHVKLVTADTSEETAMLKIECQTLAEEYPHLLKWTKHISSLCTRLTCEDLVSYSTTSRVMCMCGPPPLLAWIKTSIGNISIPLIAW